jgi:hypothetical protein
MSVASQAPWLFFVIVMVFAWVLTPGLFILIGWVFEGRKIPLHPRHQFLGFFPGDLFLGVLTGGLITHVVVFPPAQGWYTSWWWYLIVFVSASAVAISLTAWELRTGSYSKRAILSPTKLYHNGLLYVGYGSIIVSTLFAALFGAPTWWLALIILPGLAWAVCNVLDGSVRLWGPNPMHRKAFHAHKRDWQPIWVRRASVF